MSSREAEQTVAVLANDLPKMSQNMQLFSLSMRSLYAENSVSSSSENGPEFISLRDATRNDAVAYLQGVMPLNETCVLKLQEFFEYYECLSFEEWKECVEDILGEVAAYQEACKALVEIHVDMMVVLKQRQDTAKVLCKKFVGLEAKYEEEIATLRNSASTKQGWAIGLAFIPLVGAIASPILSGSASSDIAEAVAKKNQQEIMLAASRAVSDILIPALGDFIQGLEIIGGFFNMMHKELKSFDRMEERKKVHYLVLKKKSAEIKAGCRAFHGALPAVRSNFQAIPTQGTDKNYVDSWLEKQKKIIEANCKAHISLTFMRKALKDAWMWLYDWDWQFKQIKIVVISVFSSELI